MTNKTTGLLFGAGIGLGIGWLIARGGKSDAERIMILKKRPNGQPGLTSCHPTTWRYARARGLPGGKST